jgi:hypothetical protein
MGLRSGGGGSLVAVGSCGGGAVLKAPLDGGGGAVVTGSLVGSGGSGGGGGTVDLVSGESRSASLALILGARVPVGRPRGPIRILDVCLYTCRVGGESGTGMTLTGSSSSSSSAMMTSTTSSTSTTPSSPTLIPGDDNTSCLGASGMGTGPYCGWRRAVPGDPSERWSVLRVPSANRPVVRGREPVAIA